MDGIFNCNDQYFKKIREMIHECCGATINSMLLEKQYREYINEGKNPVGIIKTIEYIRDVKKIPFKNGSMSLVPYFYEEAKDAYITTASAMKIARDITWDDIENVNCPKVNSVKIKPQHVEEPKVKLFDLD